MKRILMIAPQCYPVTGAESIVNIKLLKALSDDGEFEVDLVTKKNKWEFYPSNSLEELGIKLNSITIVEVDNKISIKTIWQHFVTLVRFGVVFIGAHWAAKALPVAKELAKKNKYDYILSKDNSAPLVAHYIKKHFGVKWAATWNDPFPADKYPMPYGKGLESKMSFMDSRMVSIMQKNVDWHIFPCERIANYMQSYLKVPADKVIIAPHVVLANQEKPHSKGQILRVIHSGNLNAPRDPQTFFEGLRRFIDTFKGNDVNISVDIMGVLSENYKSVVEQLNLSQYINILKSVPYLESLEKLRSYDLALIIEAPCSEGIFLPTKVSDFMQSGIPIYSISPKIGTLNDLYNNSNIPYFSDVTDVDDIVKELHSIYSDFQTKNGLKNNIVPENYKDKHISKIYKQL